MALGSAGQSMAMSLEDDCKSVDDEEERAEKRLKLTEATHALTGQVAALQVCVHAL